MRNLQHIKYNIHLGDSLISLVAPHICEGCGATGKVLCAACTMSLEPDVAQCYRCRQVNLDGRTCAACRRRSGLWRVRAYTSYKGLAKQVVWRLKFQRVRAAGPEIGRLLAPVISEDSTDDMIVVHVPTASSRVRRRGYDQAALIARELAARGGLRYAPLLVRRGQHKQVGARRMQRLNQLEHEFRVPHPQFVVGSHILLVDDVLTTGATLEAAAKVLKTAGARKVEGIVFARA